MNLIPKIAELLGVGLDEPFKVKTKDGEKTCRFFERGNGVAYLEKYNKNFNQWTQENTEEIGKIVVGAYEVEKMPFEPKMGEKYFYISTTHPMSVESAEWSDSDYVIECAFKYCGNVFRTKAEAEAHKFEIYERLTGKKWEEMMLEWESSKDDTDVYARVTEVKKVPIIKPLKTGREKHEFGKRS